MVSALVVLQGSDLLSLVECAGCPCRVCGLALTAGSVLQNQAKMLCAETLRLAWVRNGQPRVALALRGALTGATSGGAAMASSLDRVKFHRDRMALSCHWHLLRKVLLLTPITM